MSDQGEGVTSSKSGAIRAAIRVATARLRFLALFGAVGLVVVGWDAIRARWDRLLAVARPGASVSLDAEYFCPMDPGVLSDWADKCPVCNMTLVRRKTGDTAPLPDGVVARMQFSPDRLWLGGVRTATADYMPLAREVEAPGSVVAPDRVEAEVFGRDLPWIEAGQSAEVWPLGEAIPTPRAARVESAPAPPVEAGGSVRVVLSVAAGGLRPGDRARVRLRCPVDRVEPFRSRPTVPPPAASGEPRRIYSCMDHPDVVRDAPGRCPRDQAELMARDLRPDQRVRWWCPMHPEVTADRAGSTCEPCGGMVLVPRSVSYRLPGTVLGVPASAVIEDGARALVYVESGPGMFDARAVTIGPRAGDRVAIVAGIEPGDRVAAQGAFLIDAETRLNPGVAAAYFGAGARASGRSGNGRAIESSSEPEWTSGMAAADRPLALRQGTCPVTGKPLGSMGVPAKVVAKGRSVFLCCDGCAPAVEADPARYLAKLPPEATEKSGARP